MDISSSYKNGFPFLIDINLDALAQRWLDYMRYGLYLSDAQTDEVSAQIVVYNAELGYFGNTMVYFKYIDGGKIEVKYENQTIKVQYYENWQDMIRFAMEIALAVGAVYSVYDEFVDFIMTRKKMTETGERTLNPCGITSASCRLPFTWVSPSCG